jgi:hypothetical protein
MSTGVNLPEIDINLSGDDVGAWTGEQGPKLPIGVYTFDIVDAQQEQSKKNQPVVTVTFKVADEGDQLGVELKKKYSLQQQALGRMKNLMMAAGCQLDKIRLGELIGARIIAEIIHVEGQGKVDAQGNVQPGGTFCDIIKEQPVEGAANAEPPPPPPPAAKGAAKAAANGQNPPPAAPKGAPAARRA